VGDSGEQDLELYTDITLSFRKQILGIFIRDVTTPLLTRNIKASSSTHALPQVFDGNEQPPQQREGRFRGVREPWKVRSQDRVPTLSVLQADSIAEEEDDTTVEPTKGLEKLTLREFEKLSPLVLEAGTAGEGVLEGSPLRKARTPPPISMRSTLQRSQTSKLSTYATSGLAASETFSPLKPPKFDTPERNGTEEQSSRVKKVENWKKRLARAREKLMAECGVEIWTWRVGEDVQEICEELIMKSRKVKQSERDVFISKTVVNVRAESM
jgi:hypothetical protein